jgi:hypothetical protein
MLNAAFLTSEARPALLLSAPLEPPTIRNDRCSLDWRRVSSHPDAARVLQMGLCFAPRRRPTAGDTGQARRQPAVSC